MKHGRQDKQRREKQRRKQGCMLKESGGRQGRDAPGCAAILEASGGTNKQGKEGVGRSRASWERGGGRMGGRGRVRGMAIACKRLARNAGKCGQERGGVDV